MRHDSRTQGEGLFVFLALLLLMIALAIGSACSSACIATLPDGANGYIPTPHEGGRIDQPTSDWD
ncbi:hypothetical protein [Streptomyces flaveolus]|uniref:hypothetical protein n=1 Tax=Streptomyces flaveolus TaxID=67297 RepID=UPI0033CB230C